MGGGVNASGCDGDRDLGLIGSGRRRSRFLFRRFCLRNLPFQFLYLFFISPPPLDATTQTKQDGCEQPPGKKGEQEQDQRTFEMPEEKIDRNQMGVLNGEDSHHSYDYQGQD